MYTVKCSTRLGASSYKSLESARSAARNRSEEGNVSYLYKNGVEIAWYCDGKIQSYQDVTE